MPGQLCRRICHRNSLHIYQLLVQIAELLQRRINPSWQPQPTHVAGSCLAYHAKNIEEKTHQPSCMLTCTAPTSPTNTNPSTAPKQMIHLHGRLVGNQPCGFELHQSSFQEDAGTDQAAWMGSGFATVWETRCVPLAPSCKEELAKNDQHCTSKGLCLVDYTAAEKLQTQLADSGTQAAAQLAIPHHGHHHYRWSCQPPSGPWCSHCHPIQPTMSWQVYCRSTHACRMHFTYKELLKSCPRLKGNALRTFITGHLLRVYRQCRILRPVDFILLDQVSLCCPLPSVFNHSTEQRVHISQTPTNKGETTSNTDHAFHRSYTIWGPHSSHFHSSLSMVLVTGFSLSVSFTLFDCILFTKRVTSLREPVARKVSFILAPCWSPHVWSHSWTSWHLDLDTYTVKIRVSLHFHASSSSFVFSFCTCRLSLKRDQALSHMQQNIYNKHVQFLIFCRPNSLWSILSYDPGRFPSLHAAFTPLTKHQTTRHQSTPGTMHVHSQFYSII